MNNEKSTQKPETMISALDVDEDVEYVWYVGDPVPTVGLWKRTRGHEVPIYQNTRGEAVFNGLSVSDGDIDATEPTSAFWNALNELINSDAEKIDVGYSKWFEIEFINAVAGIGIDKDDSENPIEVGQLFSIAQERGDNDD
jgi:hypothetical protein